MSTILRVEGLSKAYGDPRAPTSVLRGLSLVLEAGEFLCVMGPSGSGKSTLLHLIAGLDDPGQGLVELAGQDLATLFERLGLFREPMAGVELQLAHVESALEASAFEPDGLSDAQLDQLIASAQAARTRIHEAAYQQLHRDPYHAALGPAILGRVPASLDALVEQVVVSAASRLGFRLEQVRGRHAYAIEFGNEALIDSLPGVPGGSSFVGSFEREYAVEDEGVDFFASGHPLVEGLLSHFEEDPRGRVARLEVRVPGQSGAGLFAISKDGPGFEVVAFDATGVARPDWAEAFRRRPLGALQMKVEDAAAHDWPALMMRLAPRLGDRRPHAIAAVVVRDG
jgi:energy-coupling factor transporter ATP-binding protein EcfA2